MTSDIRISSPSVWRRASLYLPGVLLVGFVSLTGFCATPLVSLFISVPAILLVLIVGIMQHRFAVFPIITPGRAFCAQKVLRWSVALLGLRVSFGDITSLGVSVAALVIISMCLTLLATLAFARFYGQTRAFGAILGTATTVCGASAALAASTVIPAYERKGSDTVFVVIVVNTLATVAMVAYPLLW
jgi:uncharacterized membrane protein YadS